MQYHEYKYHSLEWDNWFVRISTPGPPHPRLNSPEYFMILPWNGGKQWRAQRELALGYMKQAIEAGHDPGEVFVEGGHVMNYQEDAA